MTVFVLDSYALIAYLRGETVGEHVLAILEEAAKKESPVHMTEVNYAEVKYMLVRKHGSDAWLTAVEMMSALPIQFHSATRELSDIAGDFKSRMKMSLADAFAAALAKTLHAQLVTGDREFRAAEDEIKIKWLS
jgi:predicted nucleic acid-binding protein